MSDLPSALGERIKAQRKQVHLTQQQVAEKAGIHQTYVGQIERGEKNITVEMLCKVAEAIDTTPSNLLDCISEPYENSIPRRCYEAIVSRPEREQKLIEEMIYTFLDIRDFK